jgi:hypothetical protein
MNEFFGVEPTACCSVSELRELLSKFGPATGRYLKLYPDSWRVLVTKTFANASQLEQTRVAELLLKAKRNRITVSDQMLPYDNLNEWVDNALLLLAPPPNRPLDGVVLSSQSFQAQNCFTLDTLDLPPNAEEQMPVSPEDFVRVSRLLLRSSPELVFIDPYCRPYRADTRPVLWAMLKEIATGKCGRVVLCGREEIVLSGAGMTVKDIESDLQRLRAESSLPDKCELELRLFDDDGCRVRMHARYLLSVFGGIRFDRGFQAPSNVKRMDVAPLSPSMHRQLMLDFVSGDHDMKLCCWLKG